MELTTRYLGLTLKNPLIASASPLGFVLENIVELEDKGAAAVVLPSIFEEQLEAPVGAYFPPPAEYRAGPQRYLELIRRARESVEIKIIASLNGTTDTGWIDYAKQAEQAGAHALELNLYIVPTDFAVSGEAVEQRCVDILRHVKQAVAIPVAVKLGPGFSAPGHFIHRLDAAGADGVVLFNRVYQPDIDLKAMRLEHDLALSTPHEIRLPLLWISLLAGEFRGSIAASTGVDSADEVIKYLLAGADVVMTTSALLRYGISHMAGLLSGLSRWLSQHDANSVDEIRGQFSRRRLGRAGDATRADYLKILQAGDRRES
jgi:dihydroorotate dehydrogenase (fumarate)